MSDPQRTARRFVGAGVTVSVVAAVVAFVYLLQPWRTCPDDTVPAACPALPQDAAVLTVALVVMLLSFVLTGVGWGVWTARRRD
jgi:hypothetical protein